MIVSGVSGASSKDTVLEKTYYKRLEENHSVWRSTQWISVAEHEEARKIENYESEKIYCINS